MRIVLVISLLFVTACGLGVQRSGGEVTPDVTLAEPTSAPAGTRAPEGRGRLELTLFDDNERHPAGIPVLVGGKTIPSDANGVVRFAGAPGEYTARVLKGCQKDVVVHDGGTARFRLVGNRVTTGQLLAQWQHRYGPSPPVRSNIVGAWPISKHVDVTYGVADHCDGTRAPKSAFPFTFDTSSNVEVVGTPAMRSNDEGLAKVRVMCTAKGAVGIALRDRDDPSATFDLDAWLSDYSGRPRCR